MTINLKEVKWIDFPSNKDSRGILTAIENNIDIPFPIERIFYVHHIISERGGHAHMETDQVIIAISGSFKVDLSDGIATNTYDMCNPAKGLYVPRMIFIRMYDFSDGAVCQVLANTHYDISKSIRTWEDYINKINR